MSKVVLILLANALSAIIISIILKSNANVVIKYKKVICEGNHWSEKTLATITNGLLGVGLILLAAAFLCLIIK